jgi:hypothetical protein
VKLEDIGTEMLGELMLEVTKNYKPPTTTDATLGIEQAALTAAVNAIQVWMTNRAARALTEAAAS